MLGAEFDDARDDGELRVVQRNAVAPTRQTAFVSNDDRTVVAKHRPARSGRRTVTFKSRVILIIIS